MYAKLKHNLELPVLLEAIIKISVFPLTRLLALKFLHHVSFHSSAPSKAVLRASLSFQRVYNGGRSMAVAVLRLTCSVYITASRITFPRKILRHYPKKE